MPGIYTKLIDIDKVDLLVSSYGTNLVVPAMPVVIQNNRLFFGLFALARQRAISTIRNTSRCWCSARTR